MEHLKAEDPRIESAVGELQQLIQERYPSASFSVYRGEDPEGVYLGATVDVDDTDEVMDTIIDRLLEIQVDERLPVFVVTSRPIERVLQEIRSPNLPRRYRSLERPVVQP